MIGLTASIDTFDKWFDIAAPAKHEGIGDMDQRRQIDIGRTARDQLDKSSIDAAILRLLLVNQDMAVMR